MKNGYTLIELMIVMSIMALVGIVTFVNVGVFKEDQVLKKATSDTTTTLRTIQSNASSGVKCQQNSPLSWKAKFYKSGQNLFLDNICEYTYTSGAIPAGCSREGTVVSCLKGTYSFDPNLAIPTISSGNCQATNLSTNPVTLSFVLLTGRVSFSFQGLNCTPGAQTSVELKNNNTTGTLKTVRVDRVGLIR